MQDTREKILAVAQELVQRVGVNAMSYQHISDAVGVRKASIHHHFPKKAELIEALLLRCQSSYGDQYRQIVGGEETAPQKLQQIAEVFAAGLQIGQLCLVGTISADLNTLPASTREVLAETIRETQAIFLIPFLQGAQEGSLRLGGSAEESASSYFSFLLGAQISARAYGGLKAFDVATAALISSWEHSNGK